MHLFIHLIPHLCWLINFWRLSFLFVVFVHCFLSHVAWYRVGNIALRKALEVKSGKGYDYMQAFILLFSCLLLGIPSVYPAL